MGIANSYTKWLLLRLHKRFYFVMRGWIKSAATYIHTRCACYINFLYIEQTQLGSKLFFRGDSLLWSLNDVKRAVVPVYRVFPPECKLTMMVVFLRTTVSSLGSSRGISCRWVPPPRCWCTPGGPACSC